jgi:hypothetical protein
VHEEVGALAAADPARELRRPGLDEGPRGVEVLVGHAADDRAIGGGADEDRQVGLAGAHVGELEAEAGVDAAGVHRDEVDAVLAQQREGIGLIAAVAEERLVAQLDGVGEAGGQAREEGAQARQLRAVEPWRQLQEQRAELVAERRDAIEERRDLRGAIDQQLVVADLARELEAEAKLGGHLIAPARHGLGGWQRIERRVAFDRVEHPRVALEELGWPRARWEQPADPALEPPARAAEVVPADRHRVDLDTPIAASVHPDDRPSS